MCMCPLQRFIWGGNGFAYGVVMVLCYCLMSSPKSKSNCHISKIENEKKEKEVTCESLYYPDIAIYI